MISNRDETSEQKGMRLFFELLKNKVVSSDHELYHDYWDNEEVKSMVSKLAEQSGTVVIAANSERLQLLSKASGSVFATNFTHLKSKYTSSVGTKKEFYLIGMIIMTYLAHIDSDIPNKEGMTLFAIHEECNKLFKTWENKFESDISFGEHYGIAMGEIGNIWTNLDVRNEQKKKTSKARKNKISRLGFIQTAMELLKDEGLVFIADKESIETYRVIPKEILYERLWEVYHNQNRYWEVKDLILESVKGQERLSHAKN